MKKKLIFICCVVLCFSLLLSACSFGGGSLSAEKKEEIDKVCQKQFGVPNMGQYYGTFNDCIISMAVGEIASVGPTVIEVAGYYFTYGATSFLLIAYKDGTAYLLKDAYEAGLLDEEDIERIHDCHVKLHGQMDPDYCWTLP